MQRTELPFYAAYIKITKEREKTEMVKFVKIISQATIDEVTADICDHYCKYPGTWDAESKGVELYESEVCKNCPLNRLAEEEQGDSD